MNKITERRNIPLWKLEEIEDVLRKKVVVFIVKQLHIVLIYTRQTATIINI